MSFSDTRSPSSANARVERQSAAITPATSALTPARSRHHQSAVPPNAYGLMSVTYRARRGTGGEKRETARGRRSLVWKLAPAILQRLYRPRPAPGGGGGGGGGGGAGREEKKTRKTDDKRRARRVWKNERREARAARSAANANHLLAAEPRHPAGDGGAEREEARLPRRDTFFNAVCPLRSCHWTGVGKQIATRLHIRREARREHLRAGWDRPFARRGRPGGGDASRREGGDTARARVMHRQRGLARVFTARRDARRWRRRRRERVAA